MSMRFSQGTKPMRLISLLIGLVSLATSALAHQDTVLSVRADGVVLGLPSIYQKTRLHIGFSGGSEGALQQLTFLSSGGETRIQPCLLQLVPKGSRQQVLLLSSWYHDEALLPHYLGVYFLDPSAAEALPHPTGVQLLFSLRDASLLEVKIAQARGRSTVQFRDILLSNGCPSGESADGSVTIQR